MVEVSLRLSVTATINTTRMDASQWDEYRYAVLLSKQAFVPSEEIKTNIPSSDVEEEQEKEKRLSSPKNPFHVFFRCQAKGHLEVSAPSSPLYNVNHKKVSGRITTIK
ncbi:hypothetical protein PsorP6_001335 [Peronosclerospora sorghi]|uniref:Uncharacterized protein n=1 Tax=Peronosclerospora sorghi TaxID=230839 RepID=A0ACC0WWF4_9STRA|nr:hypothetical protein PsorP6_001335 [Peronosclerospora sorghi]